MLNQSPAFKSSMAVTNANSHGWFESWMQGREHDRGLQEQQTEESLVQFEEDDETRLEQALTLLSTGNLVRSAAGKLKQLHFGWMNVGQMKAWLGVELFSSLSRGCREKSKEKVRLREAQVHAALSVTSLAAVPSQASLPFLALVATVCAEAAESMGADRERAASGISTGLATKTSADMVTLIATAATCLRGAATLELRAATTNPSMS
ncbi:hypothetical protein OPV22_005446 [Ensete ventricosum]|uniref:VAN3-binding protein-like auxin canalisation domain-containing protein n=1 Tax=Ensete ventricosum TaxID=4639 RepID=A0AAV8RP80_ENSVE|nr:hypothetical protein OPV22_005446 [Ensete ventricosum]